MAHPTYMRESTYKHSSVDDRESYTEGFRRMNGISPFPAPLDSPLLAQYSCRFSTMEAQQPSSPRTIYQYSFALLLYIWPSCPLQMEEYRLLSRVFRWTATLYWHFPPTPPLSLSIFLFPFHIKATIDPECSRLFKIGSRVGSTSVRAIRLGESRQGSWSISW